MIMILYVIIGVVVAILLLLVLLFIGAGIAEKHHDETNDLMD
jgi:uncharacterized membrane protein YqiK